MVAANHVGSLVAGQRDDVGTWTTPVVGTELLEAGRAISAASQGHTKRDGSERAAHKAANVLLRQPGAR
jgi:hypothetical protein